MNTIVHAIDGRLRLKITKIRRNTAAAKMLEESLRTIEGVKRVKVTPLTGSVLIEYDEWQISSHELVELFGVGNHHQATDSVNGHPNAEPGRLRRAASEALLRVMIEVACQLVLARIFRFHSFR